MRALLLCGSAALLLAACGGGGSAPRPPVVTPDPEPDPDPVTGQVCLDPVTVGAGDPREGLDPALPPSGNFDLLTWRLDTPVVDPSDGDSASISERELDAGYILASGGDQGGFETAADGGLRFTVSPNGPTTSGSSFPRSELREMLRRGDTSIRTQGVTRNNWVMETAPLTSRQAAGGVNGDMCVTLAVNSVTSTGDANQIGRIVIGQIHGAQDEPIRLYYRKLPGNARGAIYFAHEPTEASGLPEVFYEMIGTRSRSAPDPAGGIPLGDVFSYTISLRGDDLTVTVYRDGEDPLTRTVDISASGYSAADEWMYFKVGAYLQDNTSQATDLARVTVYRIEKTHDAPPS